jgi:hypothetical protein
MGAKPLRIGSAERPLPEPPAGQATAGWVGSGNSNRGTATG